MRQIGTRTPPLPRTKSVFPGKICPALVLSQKRSTTALTPFAVPRPWQIRFKSQLPPRLTIAKVEAMKIEKPGQHLDHMLRTTRTHHVELSSMADMKANMLLTMSAIVITLATPQVFKSEFQWPFIVLIVSSLITIALAAYAVMPRIPLSQKGPAPDIRSPRFNLLFFGDFTRLNYSEFETAMEEMLNDHNRVYEAQAREIYLLGTFLARKKYRFLRLAYLSFIAGAGCCVLLLIVLILT